MNTQSKLSLLQDENPIELVFPETKRWYHWRPQWWLNFLKEQARKAEIKRVNEIHARKGFTLAELNAQIEAARNDGYLAGSQQTQAEADAHLADLITAFATALDLNKLNTSKLIKVVHDHWKLAQKTRRDKAKEAALLQKQVDALMRDAGIAGNAAETTQRVLLLLKGVNLNNSEDTDLPS